MAESPEPSRKRSEVTRLLFKAVQGLPEAEQRAVFEYLLERGMAEPPQPFFGGPLQERVEQLAAKVGPAKVNVSHPPEHSYTLGPGPHQMVPVRFSESQHRRLKDWCAEHDFPMAVVVRGLVERFLDDWERRAA